MGCSAQRDLYAKDGLTVRIDTGGKDTDITIRMECEEDLAIFMKVFNAHAAFYSQRPIAALKPDEW